jgi:hypothetical protein
MPAPKDPVKYAEWIKKLRLANLGKSLSAETRKKISESLLGVLRPSEVGRKISASKKGKPSKLLGRPKSEATRRKMSESQMGRRGTNTGKKFSCSHRKKISESLRGNKNCMGHHHSEVTKKKLRESHLGERGSNWKGGISFEPYCQKFNNEFKERVRAFFGYKCMMPGCDHTWQQGEKRLAVHHVNFRKDACCAEGVVPLFVPLCSGVCHNKTQTRRPYWEQYFTELINRDYCGKCYFTKEEMERL